MHKPREKEQDLETLIFTQKIERNKETHFLRKSDGGFGAQKRRNNSNSRGLVYNLQH